MKQNFRKVPPYMTKTGVQIGLLYQEPFELRASKDADALQKILLDKRLYKPKRRISIDLFLIIIAIIGFMTIIVGAYNHVL